MQQNGSSQGGENKNTQGPKQSGLSWSTPAQTTQQQQKPLIIPQQSQKGNMPPLRATDSGTKKGGKRFLGIIAGGILLGFAVGWAWYSFKPSSDEAALTNTGTATSTNTGSSVTTSGVPAQTNTTPGAAASVGMPATGVQVSANDTVVAPTPQAPGTRVHISSINVSAPTWVVLYDNKNGVRGNALGAGLFMQSSSQSGVYLTLLRTTVAGQSYLLGRSLDNGDKIFSLQKDNPVVDAAGAPIYQTIEVR